METKSMCEIVCEMRDKQTEKEIQILRLQHEINLMEHDISMVEMDLKMKAIEIEILGNESIEQDLNEVLMVDL
jgi:hypothetical protein